jgi:hypothetical protein
MLHKKIIITTRLLIKKIKIYNNKTNTCGKIKNKFATELKLMFVYLIIVFNILKKNKIYGIKKAASFGSSFLRKGGHNVKVFPLRFLS